MDMKRRDFFKLALATPVVALLATQASFKAAASTAPPLPPRVEQGDPLRARDWNTMRDALADLQRKVG